jgi:ribosome-binding protein aMBF1 (putative translation factor)
MQQRCDLCQELTKTKAIRVNGSRAQVCFHCFYSMKLESRIMKLEIKGKWEHKFYYNEWEKSS